MNYFFVLALEVGRERLLKAIATYWPLLGVAASLEEASSF